MIEDFAFLTLPAAALFIGIGIGFARGMRRGRLDGMAELYAREQAEIPKRVEAAVETIINPKIEAAFAAGFRKGVDTCVRAGLHLPENADPAIQEQINIRIAHARGADGGIVKACRSGAI